MENARPSACANMVCDVTRDETPRRGLDGLEASGRSRRDRGEMVAKVVLRQQSVS